MSASSIFAALTLPGKTGSLPPFLYGTAWKKDATTALVFQALRNGFTAIDTACQPRHYREDLVGEAVRKFLNQERQLSRRDLHIQTKFTSVYGQDPNDIPYNPRSPLADQVHASVKTSLMNFTINESEPAYLDSLILHSPMPSSSETLEVWQALESYVPGQIRALGMSNTSIHDLLELYERATIKPSIVQNRFYADTKYDIAVRRFCRDKGLIYQSFWTLTANPKLLKSRPVGQVAAEMALSAQEALYVLVLGLGNTVVLNGTTNEQRMRGDLNAVRKVKASVEGSEEKRAWWEERMKDFRKALGETVDVLD